MFVCFTKMQPLTHSLNSEKLHMIVHRSSSLGRGSCFSNGVNGREESHILVFCMCWTALTTFTHITLHRSVAGDHFHHVSACCVCLHAASSGKQSFDPSHFYSRLCPGQRPAGLVILSPLPPHSCSPLSTRTTSFFFPALKEDYNQHTTQQMYQLDFQTFSC